MDDRRASSLAGDLIRAADGESVSVLEVRFSIGQCDSWLVCCLRLFDWSGCGLAPRLLDGHESIVIRFDKVRDLFGNLFGGRPRAACQALVIFAQRRVSAICG